MAIALDWLSPDHHTRHWRWAGPVTLGLVLLDQLTKAWVLATPHLRPWDCLADARLCGRIELSPLVDISMTWNHGVSFGVLQAEGFARWGLFGLIGLVAAGFILWLLRAERRTTALALALITGGAVGNLIDRAAYGAVVDFVDFSGPWFGLTLFDRPVGFPWIFNLADAAISVGAVLLLVDQLLAGRRDRG